MESFLVQSFKEFSRRLQTRRQRFRSQMPYLRLRELDIFEEVIRRLAPRRVLEWGSGFSSIRFPRLLSGQYHWLAVEHDRKWYERLAALNQNPHVEIRLIEPNHMPFTGPNNDGAYADLRDYVDQPAREGPYDLVIVDGRARLACLAKAKEILAENGVVLLHDAHRHHYAEGMRGWPYQALFTDYRRNGGGIWLGSRDRPIETVLDVPLHQQRWRKVKNRVVELLRI